MQQQVQVSRVFPDGNCEVFYLQDGEAVFASFAGPPQIISF